MTSCWSVSKFCARSSGLSLGYATATVLPWGLCFIPLLHSRFSAHTGILLIPPSLSDKKFSPFPNPTVKATILKHPGLGEEINTNKALSRFAVNRWPDNLAFTTAARNRALLEQIPRSTRHVPKIRPTLFPRNSTNEMSQGSSHSSPG